MPRRTIFDALILLWTMVPWAFLLWLGDVIACRRWSGWMLGTSLSASLGAAWQGWWRVCRWGERVSDQEAAALLRLVPDPEPWEESPQLAQCLKAAHLGYCQRRWGVNARSSGWVLMQKRGWFDLAAVPACMLASVHAWWLIL